ncbi:MAG: response regulator transcription factor [Verrucomicrobiota bacterium]|nr:response regulator transcription factor [Verrucomicrobiota bacterium]
MGIALAALVERCGHEVAQVVSSGLEAIQAYSRLAPDVVLMDYKMPRLNGATACRMILSKNPDARIILVTGMAQLTAVAEAGAVAIIPKPVDMDRLYSALYDAGTRPPPERIEPEPS